MIATTTVKEALALWIEENLLSAKFLNDKVCEIEGVGKFLIVEPKSLQIWNEGTPSTIEDVIFDPDFQIVLNDREDKYTDQVDYLLFQFGDKWYYTQDLVPESILEFKYLGKPNLSFDQPFPFLGVHGGFELCNGSRNYEDWIKKAKFLGINTLGICEENTLAGTLEFQEACKKSGIKPIIGETITMLTRFKSKVNFKLYVKNEEGWKNLLWINKIINVDNGGEYIKEEELFNRNANTEGLICILSPEINLNNYWGQDKFDFYFAEVYYQLDFVAWDGAIKDEQWLTSLKAYFDNYLLEEGNSLLPVLICDAYYLDKGDAVIKKVLNSIGKVGFKNNSKDQYFKSLDDIYFQVSQLFSDTDERWELILDLGITNVNAICDDIDFTIPVGVFRLPQFEMTLEQAEKYKVDIKDNEGLFLTLINEGFFNKVSGKVANEKIYGDRINEEVEVIKRGGFVSYFLILWDILEWCKTQGIWYGIGRGSAAGSLVSYLMGIVGIDPIKYGLLFSRFLNAGRLGKSLPDIDLDFQGERRDEVKRYMEARYGADYVTAIGTYTTMKIKAALKDLCRERGVDYSKTNYISGMIDDAGMSLTDLFKLAATKPDLKQFIQKNYKVFEQIPLCLNQPKTSSIHASGVVIVPRELGTIYGQMPVRSSEGVLVSEWEGEWIDKAGFLKCDILGIKQLDKIANIAKLINKNSGKNITFDGIELNVSEIFELFKNGYTEDVFQFGTVGLKAYCKELKPDTVYDLIAAVSLYRPGPMDTGMHKKYIKIKQGIEEPEYDEGTYEATKETYGIAVYQEQVMRICVDVAGFDEVEADDVRKAMGKKDIKILMPYKEKFISGGVKKGFDSTKLSALWDKLETFARYGFNKSHAASYAITGYFCQWFKYNFPLEFWTVSLQYSKEEEIINRISEINKISDIEVASVDINNSTKTFFSDHSTNTIYWAITSVKWVGEKAVDSIMRERELNGEFYSVEDFCDRIKSTPVDKRCIVNLILAGAFDKVEKITPEKRGSLIKRYVEFSGKKLSDELLDADTWKDYQWVLKQKELTGFGFIDYLKIVKSSNQFATKQKRFKENVEVLFADPDDEEDVVIAGILQNIIERKSKKGPFAQLELIDNTDKVYVTLWNESYEPNKSQLNKAIGSIIILNGKITFDSYKNSNVIHSKNSTQIEVI